MFLASKIKNYVNSFFLGVIAIALLVVIQQGGGVGSDNKVLSESYGSTNGEVAQTSSAEDGIPSYPVIPESEIPHMDCITKIKYLTPPSTIYNSEVPYNLDFGGLSGAVMQDINGDGLPDYIRSSNQTNDYGNGELRMNYSACVHLNTGSGWDQVYACYAATSYNYNSQASMKTYWGDCAGTPTANKSE